MRRMTLIEVMFRDFSTHDGNFQTSPRTQRLFRSAEIVLHQGFQILDINHTRGLTFNLFVLQDPQAPIVGVSLKFVYLGDTLGDTEEADFLGTFHFFGDSYTSSLAPGEGPKCFVFRVYPNS